MARALFNTIPMDRLLQSTLSPVQGERRAAEDALRSATQVPGFSRQLCDIAVDPATHAVSIRQLALVLLKQYIKECWELEAEERRAGKNVCPDDEKSYLKSVLPRALLEDQSKVQTAVCMAIAAIAAYDWPEQWPELFPALIQLLRQPPQNQSQIHASLKCITMLCDQVSSQHMPNMATLLLPELYRIFCSIDHATFIRASTLKALRKCSYCLSMIAHSGDDQAPQAAQAVVPMLPSWMQHFVQVIATFASASGEALGAMVTDVQGASFMCLEVVRTSTLLLEQWPKQLAKLDALKQLLPNLGGFFTSLLPVYEVYITADDVMEQNSYDTEGDRMGLESLVVCLLELVRGISAVSGVSSMLKKQLQPLVFVLLGYMQMSQQQIEAWELDPNQYVGDEDDDSLAFSVRNTGQDLLEELIEVYRETAVSAVANAVQQRVERIQASVAQAQAQSQDWRLLESTLLGIGTISEHVVNCVERQNKGKGKGKFHFDLHRFIAFLLQVLAAAGIGGAATGPLADPVGAPYLCGRALWCGARLVGGLVKQHNYHQAGHMQSVQQLWQACGQGLDPGQAVATRMCACRAVAALSRHLKLLTVSLTTGEENEEGSTDTGQEQQQQRQAAALELVMMFTPLLPDVIFKMIVLAKVANEDTLHLVLETIHVLLRFALPSKCKEPKKNQGGGGAESDRRAAVAADVLVAVEPHLTPLLIALWLKCHHDPLIEPCVQALIGDLCALPVCLPQLLPRLILPIRSLLTQQLQAQMTTQAHSQVRTAGPVSLVNSAVELLQTILLGYNNHQLPLPAETLQLCMPLVQLLLHPLTDDHSVMQSGAHCLKTVVRSASAQLVQGGDEGQKVVEGIVHVSVRLLSPDLSDSACLYAGGLVSQLLLQFSSVIPSATVLQLVGAVVTRFGSAKMPSLIEQLLTVFAQLVLAEDSSIAPVLKGEAQRHAESGAALAVEAAAESVDFVTGAGKALVDCLAALPPVQPPPLRNGQVPPPMAALEFVMTKWMKYQLELDGPFLTKLTSIALVKILLLRDSRLAGMHCHGDETVVSSAAVQGPMTRAKRATHEPAQYAVVPLVQRILTVLARTLLKVEEQEEEWDDYDSDSEEWEDEDDEDEDEDFATPMAGGSDNPFVPAEECTFLSDMLDEFGRAYTGFEDDEDEDGEDEDMVEARAHPANFVNLSRYLMGFFESASQDSSLAPYIAQLQPKDTQILWDTKAPQQ